MKVTLLTLCVLIASSSGFAKPKREPSVFFRPADTLYIEVIDNVGHHSVARNNRFRNIKKTVADVLEEIDFPVSYEVVRFGSSRYPGQPQLNLTMMKWEDDGYGQIEARFSASLKRDFQRDKLGVFYARGASGPFFSSDVDRLYNDALRKALLEMAPELNARVQLSGSTEAVVEGDGEGVEEGAPEEE